MACFVSTSPGYSGLFDQSYKNAQALADDLLSALNEEKTHHSFTNALFDAFSLTHKRDELIAQLAHSSGAVRSQVQEYLKAHGYADVDLNTLLQEKKNETLATINAVKHTAATAVGSFVNLALGSALMMSPLGLLGPVIGAGGGLVAEAFVQGGLSYLTGDKFDWNQLGKNLEEIASEQFNLSLNTYSGVMTGGILGRFMMQGGRLFSFVHGAMSMTALESVKKFFNGGLTSDEIYKLVFDGTVGSIDSLLGATGLLHIATSISFQGLLGAWHAYKASGDLTLAQVVEAFGANIGMAGHQMYNHTMQIAGQQAAHAATLAGQSAHTIGKHAIDAAQTALHYGQEKVARAQKWAQENPEAVRHAQIAMGIGAGSLALASGHTEVAMGIGGVLTTLVDSNPPHYLQTPRAELPESFAASKIETHTDPHHKLYQQDSFLTTLENLNVAQYMDQIGKNEFVLSCTILSDTIKSPVIYTGELPLLERRVYFRFCRNAENKPYLADYSTETGSDCSRLLRAIIRNPLLDKQQTAQVMTFEKRAHLVMLGLNQLMKEQFGPFQTTSEGPYLDRTTYNSIINDPAFTESMLQAPVIDFLNNGETLRFVVAGDYRHDKVFNPQFETGTRLETTNLTRCQLELEKPVEGENATLTVTGISLGRSRETVYTDLLVAIADNPSLSSRMSPELTLLTIDAVIENMALGQHMNCPRGKNGSWKINEEQKIFLQKLQTLPDTVAQKMEEHPFIQKNCGAEVSYVLTGRLAKMASVISLYAAPTDGAWPLGSKSYYQIRLTFKRAGSHFTCEIGDSTGENSTAVKRALATNQPEKSNQLKLQEQLATIEKELGAAEKDLEIEQQAVGENTARLSDVSEQLDRIQTRLQTKEAQLRQMTIGLQETQGRLERLEEQLAGATTRLTETENTLAEKEKAHAEKLAAVEKNATALAQAETDLSILRASLATQEAAIAEIFAEIELASATLEAKLTSAQQAVAESDEKLHTAETSLTNTRARLADVEAQLTGRRTALALAEGSLLAREADIARNEEVQNVLPARLEEVQARRQEIENTRTETTSAINSLQATKTQLIATRSFEATKVAPLKGMLRDSREMIARKLGGIPLLQPMYLEIRKKESLVGFSLHVLKDRPKADSPFFEIRRHPKTGAVIATDTNLPDPTLLNQLVTLGLITDSRYDFSWRLGAGLPHKDLGDLNKSPAFRDPIVKKAIALLKQSDEVIYLRITSQGDHATGLTLEPTLTTLPLDEIAIGLRVNVRGQLCAVTTHNPLNENIPPLVDTMIGASWFENQLNDSSWKLEGLNPTAAPATHRTDIQNLLNTYGQQYRGRFTITIETDSTTGNIVEVSSNRGDFTKAQENQTTLVCYRDSAGNTHLISTEGNSEIPQAFINNQLVVDARNNWMICSLGQTAVELSDTPVSARENLISTLSSGPRYLHFRLLSDGKSTYQLTYLSLEATAPTSGMSGIRLTLAAGRIIADSPAGPRGNDGLNFFQTAGWIDATTAQTANQPRASTSRLQAHPSFSGRLTSGDVVTRAESLKTAIQNVNAPFIVVASPGGIDQKFRRELTGRETILTLPNGLSIIPMSDFTSAYGSSTEPVSDMFSYSIWWNSHQNNLPPHIVVTVTDDNQIQVIREVKDSGLADILREAGVLPQNKKPESETRQVENGVPRATYSPQGPGSRIRETPKKKS